MSITSSRNVQIQFSGDITTNIIQSALDNASSAGESLPVTLNIGNNTISPPIVSGILVTALTIIPPAGNVNIITLKGANGDIGVPLHITDPTTIALDPSFVSLVLSVAVQVNGVRLIWS